MRFERPTCCIGRGTFCNQVSCSNYSAISPTESLLTSNYTTPKIDHNCHFFFFLIQQFYYAVYVDTPRWSTDYWSSRSLRQSSLRNMTTHPHGLSQIHQGPYDKPNSSRTPFNSFRPTHLPSLSPRSGNHHELSTRTNTHLQA